MTLSLANHPNQQTHPLLSGSSQSKPLVEAWIELIEIRRCSPARIETNSSPLGGCHPSGITRLLGRVGVGLTSACFITILAP